MKELFKPRDPIIAGRRKDTPFDIGQKLSKNTNYQEIKLWIEDPYYEKRPVYDDIKDSRYFFGVYLAVDFNAKPAEDLLKNCFHLTK